VPGSAASLFYYRYFMASDPHVPRSRLPEPKRGLTRSLLGTRSGQILSVLVLARLLGAVFPSWPPWVTTVSTIGLWVWAVVFLFRRISRLRTKLLWRIRRKLVISYLLIGLVPTLLILFFFLLSAFFIVGQVSSYVLNTEIRRVDSEMVKTADLTVSDVLGSRRSGAYIKDEAVRTLLGNRIAPLATLFPGSGAVYVEHRRGRIQRVIASEGFPPPLSVGTTLPSWLESAYQGPIRVENRSYLAGASTPIPDGITVLVFSPLRLVLDAAAQGMGFHIDQLVASMSDEAQRGSLLVVNPQSPESAPAVGRPARPFTLPWLTLLQSQSLDGPRERETELVFVQFGFAPMNLYDAVARNALQLGPEGPDLGKVILWVLALLAVLFLVIEVSAIFVGLVLARSITGSVHALSQGTEHVRQGDFGYKVQVRSRDQLGELADSFNLMTNSIQDLLHQSAEKERLEEELRIARTIQMSLLPKDRVSMPGLSIAALCLPANEVGGDYYDFIPLSDGRLAILIADVSGKGTSAALYMAELKGLSLSLSRMYDSPRLLLIEANKILAANLDSRSFITMVYAVIDMKQRKMTYARAGHNPILQLSANGGRSPRAQVLAPDGLGLALDRGSQFEKILEEESIPLESGDLFLFFTDGVTEAMNDRSELFGDDRLRGILEENSDLPMEELRGKMVDEVFNFAGGAVQHDDMTMVLVKVL
jgi:serine phosphatase RsbU (regulator of sigma subunit)